MTDSGSISVQPRTEPTPPKSRRLARWGIVLLLLSIVGLLLFYVVVVPIQRAMLFPGTTLRAPDTFEADGAVERWTRPVDDGEVEAFFLAATNNVEGPQGAVVFAHGNGELVDYWPDELQRYRELGLHVLLPEYRGYGRSAGKPSETGIAEDFRHFYDRLASHPDVDDSRIVFHGRSLGGGAVGALASRRPPSAVILQSTFTSLPDLVRKWFIPEFLMADRFETRVWLEDFSGPALVIHGTQDELIPFTHAEELHRSARDATLVRYEAGHNNCPPPGTDYWQQIENFLDRAQVL